MKQITTIVLTGGPCSGKTSALERIRQEFTEKGYQVLILSEAATALAEGGLTRKNCGRELFQKCVVRMQYATERCYKMAAQNMPAEKVLLVCDRGRLDTGAYISRQFLEDLLKENNQTEQDVIREYDAVFHLVTTAKGAEEFYSSANNKSRTETPEEARNMDDRILKAWENHPNRFVIENAGDFELKLNQLIHAIDGFLKSSGRE